MINKRQSILIVDDKAANIHILRQALLDLGCKFYIAKEGRKALEIAHNVFPDMIILDINMPDLNGFDICRELKAASDTSAIPVVFVTARQDDTSEKQGLELGAVDFITKPIRPDIVRSRIGNLLELRSYQTKLEELVQKRTEALSELQSVLINGLASLTEYRDPETGQHINRTQHYVKILAEYLSRKEAFSSQLDPFVIDILFHTSPLHDIGKIGIPDNILLKPGRLSPEEFRMIQQHTVIGYRALESAHIGHKGNLFLEYAKEIIYTHHERWDGNGYPRGLKGLEIPLSGRLMALSDVYDALISKRVYKEAMKHEAARKLIIEGSETQFDPVIIEAFEACENQFKEIASSFSD